MFLFDYQYILDNQEALYEKPKKVLIPKKNGGYRKLYIPTEKTRVVLDQLHENLSRLMSKVFNHSELGRKLLPTPIENASNHLHCKHLLKTDIKNFFESITAHEVEKSLITLLSIDERRAKFISRVCTVNSRLAQGYPTSSIISEIVFFDLDNRLYKLAKKNHLVYSRYVDDLCFSSSDYIEPRFISDIQKVLADKELVLNPKKTNFSNKGQQMKLTGICLNHGTTISRKTLKQTRAELHQLLLSEHNPSTKELARIEGKLNWFSSVIESKLVKQMHKDIKELKRRTYEK